MCTMFLSLLESIHTNWTKKRREVGCVTIEIAGHQALKTKSFGYGTSQEEIKLKKFPCSFFCALFLCLVMLSWFMSLVRPGISCSVSTSYLQKAILKADFHSVQNVARSTFSERFLLNYKQSSGTNLIAVVDVTHFKRKRSLKIDRATFCTEWKSTFIGGD